MNKYSTKSSGCVGAESDPHALTLDDFIEGREGPEEVIEALDAEARAASEWSKNVSAERSKNVSSRVRKSAANDDKIVRSIRALRVHDASASDLSLVRDSTTPHSPPLSAPHSHPFASAPTPSKPANDNIPVWALTGDDVKVFSASVALQLLETPPVAFTFNLTPDAIAKAKADPKGFLDGLSRSFAQILRRRLPGMEIPYWFAIDTTPEERLHIHGAFVLPVNDLATLRTIRQAMKDAWGAWDTPGKHKQVRFKRLYSDDWATYCLRNRRAVSKAIGPRVVVMNHPMRRDAEWAYSEIRRLAREDENIFSARV